MRRTHLTSTLNLCHDIFISEEITVGRKDADPAPTITLSGLRYNNYYMSVQCIFKELANFVLNSVYTAKNATGLMQLSCGFYRPDAICQQLLSSMLTSSSCIKSVNIRFDILQTCCKVMKQLASSLHAVRNLQQVCSQLVTDLLSSSRSKRCERILISAW